MLEIRDVLKEEGTCFKPFRQRCTIQSNYSVALEVAKQTCFACSVHVYNETLFVFTLTLRFITFTEPLWQKVKG